MTVSIPVFDGHNDALLRLYLDRGNSPIADFINGGAPSHIDLPKARQGNLVGGMFAVFSPPAPKKTARPAGETPFELVLAPALPLEDARSSAIGQIAHLLRLSEAAAGAIALCRTTADIRAAMAREALAVVLHMEGADAIDADLYLLDVLYAAGLRSLGLVWSRPNIFGYGVPFRFPGLPDTGPGLTAAGKRLVEACNRMGILIDLSHLNEKGFWDVAGLSQAPLVATHSNVHAISASPRNLTDRQLDAIRDSDGLVGLNFATAFLRDDGQMRADTDIEWMVRHIDGLVERLGETRVALGSDFDGATVPAEIGSAAGLQKLFEALRRHGYDEALLNRIGSGNWLSMLERTIDPQA